MSACAKCVLPVSGRDTVTCSGCSAVVHIQCSGLDTAKKVTRKNAYRCVNCSEPSSAASTGSDLEDGNMSCVLKAIQDLKTDFNATLDSKLKSLESKMTEAINTKLSTMHHTIVELGKTFDTAIEAARHENQLLREECDSLKSKVREMSSAFVAMQAEIQDMQQHSRLNNLEVAGIPVTGKEDIYAILEGVARAINVPWRREDMCTAHRVPTRQKGRSNIVVRFVSRSVRATWLAAARAKGSLLTTHVSSHLPPGRIYINEHLSPYMKAVLNQARTMVREKRLAYAWVREGRLLVRTTAEARPTRVRSMEELLQSDAARGGNTVSGTAERSRGDTLVQAHDSQQL